MLSLNASAVKFLNQYLINLTGLKCEVSD